MTQNIFFVRILVKLDVKFDSRIFIYWLILKILSVVFVCVYALANSHMFMCVSVPVRHLKMNDKFFAERTILIILHTPDFQTETTGSILSKEAWKQVIHKKWKLAPIALVLKRRRFWKSKAINKVTPETSNCTYWKIFP